MRGGVRVAGSGEGTTNNSFTAGIRPHVGCDGGCFAKGETLVYRASYYVRQHVVISPSRTSLKRRMHKLHPNPSKARRPGSTYERQAAGAKV